MVSSPRCGTPQVSTWLSDKDPLTENCCVRFSKYDCNYFNEFPDIPLKSSLDRRMSWSTVSKPFFRSIKITAIIFPISLLYAQESVASRKAVTAEKIARNPD